MEIHSIWEEIVLIIRFCGVGIPLLGILILSKKEQGNTSTNLMIANIGCLVMNSANLLMMYAMENSAGMMSYKMKELGNFLFCFFFAKFFLTYTGLIKKKIISFLMHIFLISEILFLLVVWDDKRQDVLIKEADFVEEVKFGISYLKMQTSIFFRLKDAVICILFIVLLFFIFYKLVRAGKDDEKRKLFHLFIAQILIVIPFLIRIFTHNPFDFGPILSSFAVINIIASVMNGDSYYLLDSGRNWAIENMNSIFIIVDRHYGYVDSNALANIAFPQLRYVMQGRSLPSELNDIFINHRSEIKIGDNIYEKEMIPLVIDRKTKGYCLMLTDITKQYHIMEELKEAKLLAEDANKAKSDFISNMSHEIRTPMNAIVGITEILLRNETRPMERGYLINIKNSGAALLTIINDILDFSKIESGKLEIIEDEYEPMSFLSDLSMIFMNRIGEKHIELLYDIDQRLPVKLYGDSLRIRQVIINIVNNAIKFTEEGYVKLILRMRDTEDPSRVFFDFTVKDSGQGIKEEDMGKLFGSFSQVDTRKNRNKEGTGLGLSISKQLVELMGGTIGVRSTYGEGSEFYFTIPQQVLNDKRAAFVKNPTGKVSAVFDSEVLSEQVKRLSKQYEIDFVDFEDIKMADGKITYLFTDEVNYQRVSDEYSDYVVNICILQNPMMAKHWADDVIVVNKPLYTLNYCQILNQEHEMVVGEAIHNDYSFIAPEANILIVDDNEMNLKVARGLLEPLQMNIETADNGKTAIAMAKSKKYHLIFMDHMMPVMDGVETTEHIRNMEDDYFKEVPIIALTANAVVGAREVFKEAGMNDFVAKPIEMKTICTKLKQWLPSYLIQKGSVSVSTDTNNTQKLPEIEGLNVEEGIKNSGNMTLFTSLLGDYYKLIDLKAQKMERCLEDHLLRDFTIEVHALKNTSRMIGAMELSEQFLTLENLGNEENEEEIRKMFPETLKLFKSYKPVLEPYGKSGNEQKKEVSKEQIQESLKKIANAMDEFDLDAADEALKELDTYKLPDVVEEKMDELRAFIADVAMEDVMQLTQEMLGLL